MTVAIITRTKNRPMLLKRALKSVSIQDFNDYVHIIVNDGGNENEIHELIQQLPNNQQEKILYLCNKTSIGMEASSNRAIQESNSEYIAFLDDDDTWEPNFLSTTIEFLDSHPNDMGITTKCNYIQEEICDGKAIILNSRPYKPHISSHSLYEICIENNILNHSFVYRRSALDTVGLYNETLKVLGDWDFNLRFLRQYDIPLLPARLANYHVRTAKSSHGNTITINIDLHKHTRMQINNRELRKDLLEGSLGFGFLINASEPRINQNLGKKVMAGCIEVFNSFEIIQFIMRFFPNKHAKELRNRFKSI